MTDRNLKSVVRWFLKHWIRHDELVRIRQQIRYLGYSEILRRSEDVVDLSLYELGIFSQNGEDGVIQEIFKRIGCSNQTFVEIGASANEANCILLADVFGWNGTFIDASPNETSELSLKYGVSSKIRVVEAFVTPNNINELLAKIHLAEDFDLLSIDVDGNDYWIWAAIKPFKPRVLIIEYNSALDPQVHAVNNYQREPWDGTTAFGSSLRAMIELGDRIGYQLVHAETTGANLFFVRTDQFSPGMFPTVPEVRTRVANFYLYGLRHPSGRKNAK